MKRFKFSCIKFKQPFYIIYFRNARDYNKNLKINYKTESNREDNLITEINEEKRKNTKEAESNQNGNTKLIKNESTNG